MAQDFDFKNFEGDFSTLGLADKQNLIATTMDTLDNADKESTIIDAAKTLPVDGQKAVGDALPLPGDATKDWIWKTIIGAFVFVFVGTAIAMGYSLLRNGDGAAFDKLLIMFTTVVGFLVGLLAPSPIKK